MITATEHRVIAVDDRGVARHYINGRLVLIEHGRGPAPPPESPTPGNRAARRKAAALARRRRG